MYFIKYLKNLKLHRLYIYYAIAYGFSTLIIPLGAQFLVNNLALAGIWANIVTFVSVIGFFLVIAQILKHTEVILVEYLQREIFLTEIKRWRHLANPKYSHYYFEIYNLLKAFSKSYSNLIDIGLIATFGLLTIVVFHPAFLILPLVIALVLFLIKRSFKSAYETSILESDQKYRLYDELVADNGPCELLIHNYLDARDDHFVYIRRISFRISALHAFSQFYVLVVGCYLIQIKQLSVGQLIAAEIIISGVMAALLKLPNSLEALFDFETSHYKIEKALQKEAHEES